MKTTVFASMALLATMAANSAHAVVEMSQLDAPGAFSTLSQRDDGQLAVLSGNLIGSGFAHAATLRPALPDHDELVLSNVGYRVQPISFKPGSLGQNYVLVSQYGQMDGGHKLPVNRMSFPLVTEFGPISLFLIGLGLLCLTSRRPSQPDKFSD